MTSVRDLGTIPPSLTQANQIWWFWFASITLPTGIQRFTDHPFGDQTLSVDGLGSNTWTGSDGSDLQVDHLDQSQQNILSVSAINFANLGNPPQFTTWANTAWADGTSGLRGKKVQIWQGWFDASNTFQGAVKVYEGTIDNQDLGARAMLALKPYLASWSRNTPWAIPSPTCIYPYKDATTCQYSGVGSVAVTAGGTGYGAPPTVVFTPTSGGSGAAGTAVLSGTSVVSVTMTAAGSGYITPPTVSFTPVSGGSGATATASSEIVGETTCGKTRTSCTSRFNQAHFGGFDLMPRPGDTVHWVGQATQYGGGSAYFAVGNWGPPRVRIVRTR